ncbi:replication protein A 70 kDa DNA-binding subunit D-like [Apium graveolens]|uniref:replication protein A 70 kDa DNA-binding subunit D-like n=1 Tax=Apium graveolens TaxID=4045 RepID=UPI003D7B0CB5
MTSSDIITLASLTPNSEKEKVLIRVTRIWEAINKRNGTLLHTNIILLDQQGNHMMAIVRNNQKQIYLPLLKENEVYTISDFKVVPGPKNYKTVDAAYTISFYYKTKIEKTVEPAISIPQYKFELRSFPDMENLVGNVTMLIDVIGLVKSYGRMEKRNNGAEKIDLVLTDHRQEYMLVTLWEEKARQFLDILPATVEEPVFLVITGLLAKKFSAMASLSSTDATRCFVNIDYEPLSSLKKALYASGKNAALHPPKKADFVASTGEAMSELLISSILSTTIPPETQAVRCICRAKIVAILNGNSWFYNCCPTCAHAIKPLDGKFVCLTCEEDLEQLAQRFRVVAGVPLQKILAEEAVDTATIPPVVNNIIGKYCAFQLKITPYNIIQGCEEYTVTRVSEIIQASMAPASGSTATSPSTRSAKKQNVA